MISYFDTLCMNDDTCGRLRCDWSLSKTHRCTTWGGGSGKGWALRSGMPGFSSHLPRSNSVPDDNAEEVRFHVPNLWSALVMARHKSRMWHQPTMNIHRLNPGLRHADDGFLTNPELPVQAKVIGRVHKKVRGGKQLSCLYGDGINQSGKTEKYQWV